MAEKRSYNAVDIQVLKGLEAVRKRPAMYVGSTGSRGLHHILFEVVDNSVDEALAGACDSIIVTIHADDVASIQDNGSGIPVDIHPELKRPAVEVVMTQLHAGSKFGGGAYKVSGGLHGVGVSCTNALSEWLEVTVSRNGNKYFQRYERGLPATELEIVGTSTSTGTFVKFKPDATIFDSVKFSYETVARRLKELAYLNKGLTIIVQDERTGEADTFHFQGGISAYVQELNATREALYLMPVHLEDTEEDVRIEVAMQHHDGYNETILGYANSINTVDGGTHISGFKSALTRTINAYARGHGMLKEKEINLSGEDVREGLTAIVSVYLSNPQFEGQTKAKLGNNEVEGMVTQMVNDKFGTFLEENPSVARRIIDKCLTAARARAAAKRASELVKRKSALESGTLPGKLADCNSRNPAECELFIVEGQSAGGNAKQGRNSRFQAILPLRGKILNAEKNRLDKLLKNEEIQALVAALGTGIQSGITEYDEPSGNGENGEETNGNGNGNGNGYGNGNGKDTGGFEYDKLRYHRIILMADADVDGSHIETLLLTFFFRYMRPLVEHGHIYVAQPPLYEVRMGKESIFAYSDEELEKVREQHKGKRYIIQRYKGLGEMDVDKLATTTMELETRTLMKINVEELAAADQMFSVLMGKAVEPRRNFISRHAKQVANLDI